MDIFVGSQVIFETLSLEARGQLHLIAYAVEGGWFIWKDKIVGNTKCTVGHAELLDMLHEALEA